MHLEINTISTAPKQYAKIFTTGRSQAVRLPKAFRFKGTEVSVERQGDAVILRPKVQSKEEWWAQMEEILSGFEGMPLEIERDRTPIKEPINFDSL